MGGVVNSKTKNMWRSALVAVVAVVAYALGQHYFEGPGICPQDPAACFFSDTYLVARRAFREGAQRLGAELHALRVSESPDLTIDVAVLQPALSSKPGKAPPTLIHMSGTHGVEAHAGSAAQLALLQKWADEPASAPMLKGVRVVLVHVVNPYGFHCGRRWNELGADLNRNVLSDEDFAQLTSKDTERRALFFNRQWVDSKAQNGTVICTDRSTPSLSSSSGRTDSPAYPQAIGRRRLVEGRRLGRHLSSIRCI